MGLSCAARFLFDVVKDLNLWFNDEAAYLKEAIGVSTALPAGLLGFRRFATKAGEEDKVEHHSHAHFKGLLQKWYLRGAQVRAFTLLAATSS